MTLILLPYTSAESDASKETVEKKSSVGVFGYWKKEDCKKISETSGALLYFAGI